jgi:hypothetical protein
VTVPTFLALGYKHWRNEQGNDSLAKQEASYGLHGLAAGLSQFLFPYAGPAVFSILVFLKLHYGISWGGVVRTLVKPIPQRVPALKGKPIEELKSELASSNPQDAARAMRQIFAMTKTVAPVCQQYKECKACPYNRREGELIKCGPYLDMQTQMVSVDNLTANRIVTGTLASFMETSSTLADKLDSLQRAQSLIRVTLILVAIIAAGYLPRFTDYLVLFLQWVFH